MSEPKFDLTDEEELEHAQSLAVQLIEENDALKAEIKELKEKLSQYEWRSIALVEQEGAKYPKDQKFDLWIKDFVKFPSLGPYSCILSNLTWCHEEGRWLTSSDEYLTDRVYIHATHARPEFTPSLPQEGDKE